MARQRVLLIGLDPGTITFAPDSRLTPESVLAAGRAARQELVAAGCEVETCLVDAAATDPKLPDGSFDVVMIGAGLRALPEHTLLFEKVINAIHRAALSTRFCFNTRPDSTVEAVLRWL